MKVMMAAAQKIDHQKMVSIKKSVYKKKVDVIANSFIYNVLSF
jgi:hypothetical protein